MSGLVAHLLNLPGPWAYATIALLVFAEAALFVGFVVPGETAVLLGGLLAATGHLSLGTLLVLVVVAGVVGDSVGFEVGRRLGPRIMDIRPLRRHRKRLEGASTYLREHAGRAVVLGRFTAFLRAMTPALAGASRMSYPRFLAFNVLGGVIWGSGVTLLGYLAGGSYDLVAKSLGRTSAGLLALLVIGGVLVWHRRHHRVRPAAAVEPDADATSDKATDSLVGH